jgi:hypothetical protein
MTITSTVNLHELHPTQQLIRDSRAKRKIIKAGRRGGKTVLAADLTVEAFLEDKRVLYAVPTGDQLTKWWYEITKALELPIKQKVYVANVTTHTISRPGTENRIRGKTAWNAQTLRGDFADVLILDELQYMTEEVWDEVGAPMLLDNDGDAVFIFTPPSIRSSSRGGNKMWVIDFLNKHSKDTSGRWEVFTFTSFDNPFISQDALEEITKDVSGLAYRQEILAQAILEAPGALWTRKIIDDYRVQSHPPLLRLAVAIDPSQTSGGDEAGIIAGGQGADGEYYVTADRSIQASPLTWAKRAIMIYAELQADYIVIEKNTGGEMLQITLEQAAEELKKTGQLESVDIRIVYVNASRNKQVRADPVSAIYERGMVHHVGPFFDLEDELCLWTPGSKSPNRLDALVWLITNLRALGGPTDEEIAAYAKGEAIPVEKIPDDVQAYIKRSKSPTRDVAAYAAEKVSAEDILKGE